STRFGRRRQVADRSVSGLARTKEGDMGETWFPPCDSDIEAGVLEVEVALDPAHDVVADPALAPQRDDLGPLGLEELAPEPLVAGGPLLDRVVVLAVEARAEARDPEAVGASHPLRRVRPHPLLLHELVEAREGRLCGADARLRVFL